MRLLSALIFIAAFSSAALYGAETPIGVSAFPFFGKHPVSGKWAAFAVRGRNDSSSQAVLSIRVAAGQSEKEASETRAELILPPHSTKVRFVYFPVSGFEPGISIRVEGEGLAAPLVNAYRSKFVANEHWSLVAEIGNSRRFRFSGAQVPFITTHVPPVSSIESIHIEPENAPDSWLGYGQFFAVLLAPESVRAMDKSQLGALAEYARRGGYLIVVGEGEKPVAWNHEFLSEILPVEAGRQTQSTELKGAFRTSQIPLSDNISIVYTSAKAVRGNSIMEFKGDSLVQFSHFGLGAVAFMAFRFDDSLIPDETADMLWDALLSMRTPYEELETDRAWVTELLKPAEQEGGTLPGTYVALGLALLFLLFIGPLDYIVAKYTGKRWLTWIFLPLSVAAFTGLGIWSSSGVRARPFFMNTLDIARFADKDGYIYGESYHCVMLPGREKISITQENAAAIEPFYPLGDSTIYQKDGAFVLERKMESMEQFFFKTTWMMRRKQPLITVETFQTGAHFDDGTRHSSTFVTKIWNFSGSRLSDIMVCAAKSTEISGIRSGASANLDCVANFVITDEMVVQNNIFYFDNPDARNARCVALAGKRSTRAGDSIEIKSWVTELYKTGGGFVLGFSDFEPARPKIAPEGIQAGGKSRTILILEIPYDKRGFRRGD